MHTANILWKTSLCCHAGQIITVMHKEGDITVPSELPLILQNNIHFELFWKKLYFIFFLDKHPLDTSIYQKINSVGLYSSCRSSSWFIFLFTQKDKKVAFLCQTVTILSTECHLHHFLVREVKKHYHGIQ